MYPLKVQYDAIGAASGKTKIQYALDLLRSDTPDIVVISNRSLLSEGIDISSIDCVVFMNDTNSKREIIQRVGRCIRKDGNKKKGIVCIPFA